MARAVVRGATREWASKLYGFAVIPDLTVFLDARPEILLHRAIGRYGSLDYWESGMDLSLSRDRFESFFRYQQLLTFRVRVDGRQVRVQDRRREPRPALRPPGRRPMRGADLRGPRRRGRGGPGPQWLRPPRATSWRRVNEPLQPPRPGRGRRGVSITRRSAALEPDGRDRLAEHQQRGEPSEGRLVAEQDVRAGVRGGLLRQSLQQPVGADRIGELLPRFGRHVGPEGLQRRAGPSPGDLSAGLVTARAGRTPDVLERPGRPRTRPADRPGSAAAGQSSGHRWGLRLSAGAWRTRISSMGPGGRAAGYNAAGAA